MFQQNFRQRALNDIYIKASQVTLQDATGKTIGTFSPGKAKNIANERGMKLVPVNEHSNPAIYKMTDPNKTATDLSNDEAVSDTCEVRLIDENRQQLGIMTGKEAKAKASEAELDLIVVAENATPIVCMLGNLNKYLYNKKKAQKEMDKKNRAAAKASEEKELALPSVVSGSSNGDMTRLIAQGNEFLGTGHPVKFKVRFFGRQIGHAKEEMVEIESVVRENITNGTVNNISCSDGKTYYIMCSPLKKK